MEDNIYLEYDLYMEAAKLDPEKNKQEILRRLKYKASDKTIEIRGIDGRPYRCKLSIEPNDFMAGNGGYGILHTRRTMYANQMSDGTPYIRIPPHMLNNSHLKNFFLWLSMKLSMFASCLTRRNIVLNLIQKK